MSLILIRGLPGSGKTTLAKKLEKTHPNAVHLEADMYFMKDGKYEFNAAILPYAHKWCADSARIFMDNGKDVIVSNTFSTNKEMKPYVEHAQKLKIDIKVYRMKSFFGSIHDVPEETIEKMRKRFENCKGEEIVG